MCARKTPRRKKKKNAAAARGGETRSRFKQGETSAGLKMLTTGKIDLSESKKALVSQSKERESRVGMEGQKLSVVLGGGPQLDQVGDEKEKESVRHA